MILYHFTSRYNLRGIARYGLTVGDVPTDIFRGKVGVWLTSAITPDGHGLSGALHDKGAYRLEVEIQHLGYPLAKWTDWAPKNVTAKTIAALQSAKGENFESWYIFFGVIAPDSIKSCTETATGADVPNFGQMSPTVFDNPGIAGWRREKWHRRLLKETGRAVAAPGS